MEFQWDLRTFHLIHTVPALDQCRIVFNNNGTVIYGGKYKSQCMMGNLEHLASSLQRTLQPVQKVCLSERLVIMNQSEHVCIWREVWTEPVEVSVCMCVWYHSHSEPYAQKAQCWTGDRENQLVLATSQEEPWVCRNGSAHTTTTWTSQEPEPANQRSFYSLSHSYCGSLLLQQCCRRMMKTTWWRCRWKVHLVRRSGPLMPQTTNQLVRLPALTSL